MRFTISDNVYLDRIVSGYRSSDDKKMNDRFYNAYQIPGFLLFSIVLFIGLGSVNGLEQKILEMS